MCSSDLIRFRSHCSDTGNHTGFENGCGSDIAEFDLAENRDQSADGKHQAHDGCVTCDDNRFDQADSRRNSGCVADKNELAHCLKTRFDTDKEALGAVYQI